MSAPNLPLTLGHAVDDIYHSIVIGFPAYFVQKVFKDSGAFCNDTIDPFLF